MMSDVCKHCAHAPCQEVCPTGALIYNEFDTELPGPKQDALIGLIGRLAQKKLIDGVGLQMHTALGAAPTRQQLIDTMNRIAAFGLTVEITEMDVAAKGDGTPTYLSLRLRDQAEIYRNATSACEAVPACNRMTVWGISDRDSWLGADKIPLLFDDHLQPKPALAAVRETLGLR